MEEYKATLEEMYRQAKKKGACDKFPVFNGTENLSELCELMFSPQGREFCLKHRFPDINTMRTLKKYNLTDYNIYVDAGDITIYDDNCYLIGNTKATIRLGVLGLYRCCLMHGAKAHIDASGYSIINVTADKKSSFTISIKDNAIIL